MSQQMPVCDNAAANTFWNDILTTTKQEDLCKMIVITQATIYNGQESAVVTDVWPYTNEDYESSLRIGAERVKAFFSQKVAAKHGVAVATLQGLNKYVNVDVILDKAEQKIRQN